MHTRISRGVIYLVACAEASARSPRFTTGAEGPEPSQAPPAVFDSQYAPLLNKNLPGQQMNLPVDRLKKSKPKLQNLNFRIRRRS
ncbi:hypothetical protein PILCRDRAFT_409255 [Piloderma croceum F 1598]|uniref:Uncharacterized protein n=1 Tax=Piloderma croceum (strain F 1598) TaxID=765440 RepID=A0A0C3FXS5_PILCF|nr:hypothetical protein PILCRDRAFT_409255 [Piloderma croceum F 1598]